MTPAMYETMVTVGVLANDLVPIYAVPAVCASPKGGAPSVSVGCNRPVCLATTFNAEIDDYK